MSNKTFAFITMLIIALISFAYKSYSQQTFGIGNKSALNLSYGGYAADSMFRLPFKKAAFGYFDSTGRMYYNRYGDSGVYYHNGLIWIKLLSTTSSVGTVTSVTAGAGLSGGVITTSGTISMPNVGTAGTYGSSTLIPIVTTDAQGRMTSITTTTVTAGTGSVTTVTVTPLNGVSAVVSNPTTTPAIAITLGAITPSSVAASGTIGGSNFSGSSSGTNTGDQTITLTGDVNGTGTGSFSTALTSVVVAGSCSHCSITYDAKGRVLSTTTNTVTVGTITGVLTGTNSNLIGGGTSGTLSLVVDTSASGVATQFDLISYQLTPANTAISTTTYTLTAANKGNILSFTNSGAITLTIPSGLGAGFFCTVQQIGTGQVTFSASGTTLLAYPLGATKTAGQNAQVQINFTNTTNTYALQGAMQ